MNQNQEILIKHFTEVATPQMIIQLIEHLQKHDDPDLHNIVEKLQLLIK